MDDIRLVDTGAGSARGSTRAGKLSPRDWSELLSLFDSALDQPSAERDAWCEALPCRQQMKDALRRLLQDRDAIETRSFLSRLPALVKTGTGGEPLLHEGAEIGAYRLLRRVGEGGMSTVWLAERSDGQLRRRVALKIPHAGPGQHAQAARVLRERDILAALEHPHIARLYDVGIGPFGTPFLVLEYIEGLPLRIWCDTCLCTLGARLALFRQVLQAVQYAHAKLVLHRDLKPSNILVDGEGRVRLLDFGIAKLLGEHEHALTRQGGLALTPEYAAPEQIAGAALGTACDVYALGVVLFELLTGERPYRLARGSAAELERSILSAEVRRPSDLWNGNADGARFAASPVALRRALRGDLDAIVLKALRKAPGERYATAEAFEADIERHLMRQPIIARAPRLAYRLCRYAQRHALVLGAAATIVLALAFGLTLAQVQAGLTRAETAKAQAIKGFLIGLLRSDSTEQFDSARKRRQSAQELLEQSADALEGGLADVPEVRAELQGVIGQLFDDLGLSAPAARLRERRVEQLRALGAAPALQGEAMRDWARALEQRGQTARAHRVLEQTVAMLKNEGSSSAQAQRWAAQAALGRIAAADGRPYEARQSIESAAAALARLAPGSRLEADALAALAVVRKNQGHASDARALLELSFALKSADTHGGRAGAARERYAHAMLLWNVLGDVEGAEAHLRVAWEVMKSALGAQHVNAAVIEQKIGRALLQRGLVRDAQAALTHAGQVLHAHAGQVDPALLVESALYQAEALMANGRLAEAQRAMTDAIADLGTLAEASLKWRIHADWLNAELLMRTGAFDDALDKLQRWLADFTARYGPQHPSTHDVQLRIARVHAEAGALDVAQTIVDGVLAHARPAGSDGGVFEYAQWLKLLLLVQRNRFDDALPLATALHSSAHRIAEHARNAQDLARTAEMLARVHAGRGEPATARPLFEAALASYLALGYEHNPWLAQVRTAYAQCLLQLGERTAAQRQIALAEHAFRAEPLAGMHLKRIRWQMKQEATVARPFRRQRDAVALPGRQPKAASGWPCFRLPAAASAFRPGFRAVSAAVFSKSAGLWPPEAA